MSLRTIIIAGLLVAAAVTGLVYVAMQLDPPPREERAIRSAPPGARLDVPERTGDDPAPESAAPVPTDRPRPELTPVPPEPEPPFADEPRDQDWAPAKEAVVSTKVDALLREVRGSDAAAVDVTAIECRSRRCRLTIAGSDAGKLQVLIEALQDDRGFYGDAQQIMLGGMSEEDGRRELRATLLFAGEG
jgi:hypothetical protein